MFYLIAPVLVSLKSEPPFFAKSLIDCYREISVLFEVDGGYSSKFHVISSQAKCD